MKLRWLRNVVSSRPKRRGGHLGNAAIFWRAAAIVRHAVAQLTPKVRATAAIERSQPARAIARHNRAVTRRRGPTWAADSVKVPTHHQYERGEPLWGLRRFGDKPDRTRPESAIAMLLGGWLIWAVPVPTNRHWLDRGGDCQGDAHAP